VRIPALSTLLVIALNLVAGVGLAAAAFVGSSENPGNAFTASNAFNLTVTMVDPGAYLGATVSLQATAADGEDGSSITSVTIQRSPAGLGTWTDVCTDSTSPYSCSFDTTSVGEGLYDFRATVLNNVGGSANSAAVTNRLVDNTNPTATMNDPGTNLAGTVSLTASGSDTGGSGVANVKIQRSPAGAGTWTDVCTDTTSPYSCSFDTTSVVDGLYDFRAVSADNAGNSGTSATVANRRVDNTAPTPVTMTNPGSPITGTVGFSGTAADSGSGVASVTFQISPTGLNTWSDMCSDTTSPYSCSYDTSLLADGLYDYRSRALDNAGNPGTSTLWAGGIVDNGFPSATMTDPGAYLRGTVALGATADDGAGSGVANVKIQRSPAGAGSWTDVCTDTSSPYSCSFDTTLVTDGLYDFRAVATDNVSKTTVSTTVANRLVDNTNPTATMNDPGANLRGTVSLTASATDTGGSGVASVLIQRSPAGLGTWTDVCTDTTSPYSCSFDTTLVTDGLYDFRALSTDNAGNGPTTSATVAGRRVDNTLPTANLTDPGTYLRQTVTLDATATDVGGSGVASVAFERSPAGAGTWTNICTDPTFPYSCSFDTTVAGDGIYDLRAVATDNAGNTNTSTVVNRTVDNTAPTATDIQTTNGGATVGRPETSDTITFTYSEQILPGSILAGWNGSSQAVTVRMNNSGASDTLEVWDVTNLVKLPLTSTVVALNGNNVQNAVVFAATMVQSGASITITLGALASGTVRTDAGTSTMSWPPSATATDLAGNACTTTAANETGAADANF
jgi:Bacterial Ig domain